MESIEQGQVKQRKNGRLNGEGTDQLQGKQSGVVEVHAPFAVQVMIEGRDPILLHRYDAQEVDVKNKAAKGSKQKKTDNVESYVYRNEQGEIGLPGIILKSCLNDAAKYFQDPRSPRKSARDLVRASLRVGGFASFGAKDWDYLDRRRVVVQRNGITRSRPAFEAGWTLRFTILVIDPEYVTKEFLHNVVTRAGLSVGLGDYRPDFGTFRLNNFELIELE